jgi:hypothetical protein
VVDAWFKLANALTDFLSSWLKAADGDRLDMPRFFPFFPFPATTVVLGKKRIFYTGPLNFATVLVATLSFSSCSVLPNATSICSEIRLAAVSVHSNMTYSAGPLCSSILTFAARPCYAAQPPLLFLPTQLGAASRGEPARGSCSAGSARQPSGAALLRAVRARRSCARTRPADATACESLNPSSCGGLRRPIPLLPPRIQARRRPAADPKP